MMHDTSGEPCYRAKSREFRDGYDEIEWEGEDADKDE